MFENRAVYEIMLKKKSGARQATDGHMEHAHGMPDTQGYKHAQNM